MRNQRRTFKCRVSARRLEKNFSCRTPKYTDSTYKIESGLTVGLTLSQTSHRKSFDSFRFFFFLSCVFDNAVSACSLDFSSSPSSSFSSSSLSSSTSSSMPTFCSFVLALTSIKSLPCRLLFVAILVKEDVVVVVVANVALEFVDIDIIERPANAS